MKTFQTGFIRLTVLLALLTAALLPMSSASAENILWVCTSGCSHNSLQSAIAAALDGDTIMIGAGTFVESGQIVINKNLTIQGVDKFKSILMPAQDTGAAGNARGWILVNSGKTFALRHLTLDGAGKKVSIGILSNGDGVVEDTIVQNMGFEPSGPSYAGRGIAFYDVHATVRNNTLSNIGRIGIYMYHTTGEVTGNTYTGKGEGNWLDYGIELEGGADMLVSGNTVTGCKGVAVDGSGSAAVLATTFFAPGTRGVFLNNNFSGNSVGINLGYDEDDTTQGVVHYNDLSGNDEGGLVLTGTTQSVDASHNWWGSTNAPVQDVDYYGNAATAPHAVARVGGTTQSVHEVGDSGTLDTTVSAAGLYGVQFTVKNNPGILTFTGGVKNTPAGWYWDYIPWDFATTDIASGIIRLAGSISAETHPNAANPAGDSLATWTYRCDAVGTSSLDYDMDASLGSKLSDKDGFEIPAAFTGGQITCLAATSRVDGVIGLQGRRVNTADPAGWNGSSVTLTCSAGACQGFGPYVFTPTGVDGIYAFTKSGPGAGIANGTYTAVADRRGYLPATRLAVAVSGGLVSLPTPTLSGGDVDENGVVNLFDLTGVGVPFGQTTTPDTGPDLNGDGVINIFDLVLVGSNYNKTASTW